MKARFALAASLPLAVTASAVVNQTVCGGTTYSYLGLAGYGYIPSSFRDKYGDTMGGWGSAAAIEQDSWRRTGELTYEGILWVLPDRGWNTNGTLNFQNRIHKVALELELAPHASYSNPSKPNLKLTYLDSILFTDPDGEYMTGLDADVTGTAHFDGFPPLPVATYEGDGFGNAGPGGRRVSLDSEGLFLGDDGSFWVSDEYGPYVYKFDKNGKMELAIQPPSAFLPRRNGTLSFSADSPPFYDPDEVIDPADPETGRDNNQGFEGLTVSPDGRTLYTLIQSALNQEGGLKKEYRENARLLEYDISSGTPVYKTEHVVVLPKYDDYTATKSSKIYKTAAQSEIHMLPSGDFLVLARDSGFGRGQTYSRSVYRHADIFSINRTATQIQFTDYDYANGSIASSKGVLDDGITPVEYCTFLDYNDPLQLAKFGLHNGGNQNRTLLNEKWESLVVVEADPDACPDENGEKEYFLFSFSDNDFITQDGYMNFGQMQYADASGYNLDNQALVFSLRF
ncbi:hypothetical protein ASPZODRAFT_61563 [Penicilliopsis zonata CBS 506.65]|uniref:Phytase-like domain-containing protein n=1 Tax=Penicilliopsis zonata CBS 506.65 TaxID=1073090 RepID=A0A1L9SN81_9EURO|nr:hypothetical protein ASPZODRAFT_61563 [Penicilliopsis zonata CBS 506.65]OJJ48648.1 hypothetical protein ASPZODRAFT_61563 [Penicilliopsis zonata CBS 506.65]